MALDIDLFRTAILAMDFQNDIVGGTPNVEPVLDNARLVLDAGRRKQLPIIYITVSFRQDYGDAPSSSPLFQMIQQNGIIQVGTPGAAIHADLTPQANELVLNKTCVNPFLTTNLQQVLHSLDVNTLILMGLWTNYVVEATARHASDMGHRVIVVREACASNSQENHDFAIEQILPTLSTVCSLNDILQTLG